MPTDLPPPAKLPYITNTNAIDAAERAIVYCYVEWSVPERQGRPIILEAVSKLRTFDKLLDFVFFAIEEDAPVFANWLPRFGWNRAPLGAGSVLWMEKGECICIERCAVHAGVEKLISLSKSHWEKSPA